MLLQEITGADGVTFDLRYATADNFTRNAGDANPTLTGQITGLVNGDTAGQAYSGAPTYSTSADTSSVAGTYPVTPSLGTLSSSVGYAFSLYQIDFIV